jgi:hypothetical protein
VYPRSAFLMSIIGSNIDCGSSLAPILLMPLSSFRV